MKMPGIIKHSDMCSSDWPQVRVDGGWVCARPLPLYTVWNRIRATLLVFTGRADAFVWDIEAAQAARAGKDTSHD